ncbi:Por secretion system C-terminal sorting domain-containing protein [Soonwooa buanensis]|uniref:Por secretion system C-terminal sorting domain-containing protein n=1 Tax=Soonwooa buanensis TaxID=619805 RepID=A0A1T5GPC8_9FLAO|nr:T9SS type A sorting domain-containing protein [Soonwooa buanensis]SKC10276.1 Por secretion system C-terminal sorting domain-containing protein [Soonwooa buanensis]
MKKTLLSLAFLCATFAFSQSDLGKISNQLPENYQTTKIEAPAFLKNFPTTDWIDNADTSWYNSTSTSFQISTAAELAGLTKLVFNGNDFSGKTITLMQDVDLAGHLWAPIGYGYQKPFSGTFEGNHKTVKNVLINRETNGDFVGFFGQFFKATLKNLTVDGVKIFAKDTVGGMIGNVSTNSYVENCHVKNAEITITGYNGGGFSGGILTNSEVINCSASASVEGVNQIGGFVGSSWDKTKITNCFSEGSVKGEYIIGGFNGFSTFAFAPNRDNEMINCYTRSNVEATSFMAGGFFGYTQQNAILKNVYSAGTVTNVQDSGAFMGAVGSTTIQNAHFDHTLAPYDAIGKFDYGDPTTYDITAKTSSEMKSEAFKTVLNAGAATEVWSIDPSVNDGYPYLNTITTLAVNDAVTSISDVKIYPTIVDNQLTIVSSDKVLSYNIIDMSGKSVKQMLAKENQNSVDVSQLGKGIFIINIKTEKGSKSLKFIKK